MTLTLRNLIRQLLPRRLLAVYRWIRYERNIALRRAKVLLWNSYWRKVRGRRIVLVTFADGVKFTSQRLVGEATQLNFFDAIIAHSSATLGSDFTNRFKEHLKIERGYGLWAWKPYVILQTLNSMSPGDVVFYADAGCGVAPDAVARLQELVNVLMTSPETIMLADECDYRIRNWTKAEAIHHFGFANRDDVLDSKMWEAGRIALQNTPFNRTLLQLWYDAASELRLIDDSPSNCDEYVGFREHRHDQSILNLLMIDNVPLAGLERVFLALRLRE